jgi:ABC-type nitrate/sulfonate/bicarbonate transport system permease component
MSATTSGTTPQAITRARSFLAPWTALWRDIRPRTLAGQILAPLITLVVLLAGWQGYVVLARVNAVILPAPTRIFQAMQADWGNFAPNLAVTLQETIFGFAWAFVLGVAFAAMLDLAPLARRGLYPLLVASQSVPLIALAPILQFWFGIGLTSKGIVIVLSCFFPITVASLDGLAATDPEMIRLYRSFGASAWRIWRSVRLPNALPALFSGLRIAISYSVIGAIFAEYVGADRGIAVYIQARLHAFRIDLILGAIAITALASVALFLGVMVIERLAIPWYYAERRQRLKP